MSEEKPLALVIEDDYDASVIFAKAIEALGFKTETIPSGDKALERLKAVVPEIIVLDLHLPEVLGTNILRHIRAEERLKGTLVIVASADPRSADLIQDDADLVLLKPTTYSQVRDLAARLVAARRKAVAAPISPASEPPAQTEKKEEATSEAPVETAKSEEPHPPEKPDAPAAS
jgi:DNA-binding response OmpR family regulator